MIIVDSKKDYYDNFHEGNINTNIVYYRNHNIVPILLDENVYPLNFIFKTFKTFPIKVIEKNILHTANIFVIGLGGKLYPGLHYKQVDKHINKILLEQYEYSLDKSLDIIDSRFKSFSLFERKLTMLDDFVEFFKHTSDKSHDNIFKKYDIPLFYFEIKQNLILNPILSEFNFNRKMSPYLVYATIHDYFLTGTIDSGVVKKKSKKNKRLMLYEI